MSKEKTKGNRMDFRPTFDNEKLIQKAMGFYGVNRSDAINKLLSIAKPTFNKLYGIVHGDAAVPTKEASEEPALMPEVKEKLIPPIPILTEPPIPELPK